MAWLFLLRCFSRILEILGRWRILAANLVHLFTRASLDALLLGVDISVKSGFSSHLTPHPTS
jgi:hypothetical protein